MTEYTPGTLRKLFKRSVRQKFTLAELEIALDLHADAWAADLKRNDALEKALWFEHYKDVYPQAAVNHGDCEACRLLAALRGEPE